MFVTTLVFLYPIWRKHGGLVVQFNLRVSTIIYQMALLPSILSTAVENDAMAAV